jgi:GT2 family glycosyltransferase
VKAEYYMLLNSDAQVKADWLDHMVKLMESDQNMAVCQPKLLSFKNPKCFEYGGGAGGWIDKYGYPFAKGRIFDITEEDHGQYDEVAPVFWCSGAALFIRSSVFWEVGGFDEYFFAHQEEIDLCWRIQLLGYRLSSCPASIVYHVGGGTLPRGNSLKTFLNFRNNLIMLAKNLPFWQRCYKIPYRIFLDTVSATKGLINGDGGYFVAIFRAHFALIKWILFKQGESKFPVRKSRDLQGVYHHNLVWQHFIKGKKFFREIVGNA